MRIKFSGGARRDRTADLYNAIVALSQLSYDPNEYRELFSGEHYSVCVDTRNYELAASITLQAQVLGPSAPMFDSSRSTPLSRQCPVKPYHLSKQPEPAAPVLQI